MLIGFIALPMPLRMLIVVLTAMLLARFINWAIYSWAYNHRALGPWNKPPAASMRTRKKKGSSTATPARRWADHLPIIGWYRLRSEGVVFGKWYWLRPLLIELIFPVAIAWYYHFYVSGGALQIGPAARGLAPELHSQFTAHLVLFTLMAIGTFIDFDEQSIPDYVTMPGTVIGIVGAAFAPAWLPFHLAAGRAVELDAAIPKAWPAWLNGPLGLGCGLLIIGVWGFALLERRVILRRGFGKAMRFFMARLFRNSVLWKTVAVVSAALAIFVAIAWQWKIPRWQFLLSSLFGLAFAGGVTWGVRISASQGLGVEALGFGDVTLMAMIGTYVGWQPSMLVFFIAPMVAIVFVLLRTLITGRSDTPYGPYLCAATVLILVFWDAIWIKWAAPVFGLGWLIIGIVVGCVVLMGAMLWIWRLIKQGLGLAGH